MNEWMDACQRNKVKTGIILSNIHTVILNSMHSKQLNIWLIVDVSVVVVAAADVFVLEIIIATCEFGYLLKWW